MRRDCALPYTPLCGDVGDIDVVDTAPLDVREVAGDECLVERVVKVLVREL